MLGMVGIEVALAFASRAPLNWLAVLLLLQLPNMLGLVVIPAGGSVARRRSCLRWAVAVGLKLALAWIAAGVSLISTMEIDKLVEGMRGIGVPSSIAAIVGYVFLLAYLGFSDILQIIEGMRLKGVELTIRRPVAFMRGLIQVATPMIFTIVRRGAQMTAALDTRGFSFRSPKVRRARLKFDFADATVLMTGLAVVGYAGMVRADVLEAPPALEQSAKSDKKSGSERAK
jgi:energy-coupling factor transport system permease protein